MALGIDGVHGPDGSWVGGYLWPSSCKAMVMLATQVILFGIVAAQLADAMTFTVGVMRFGIGVEANGVAATLYDFAGLTGVLAVKGGVIVATIAILVATARDFPRLVVWGGAFATTMGLLGFTANAWTMAILG